MYGSLPPMPWNRTRAVPFDASYIINLMALARSRTWRRPCVPGKEVAAILPEAEHGGREAEVAPPRRRATPDLHP